MSNMLKVILNKNHVNFDSADCKLGVVMKNNIDIHDIVDMMIAEGVQGDKQFLLDIIVRFNHKAAELATSGHPTDTGLVFLIPEVKKVGFSTQWHPLFSKPAVSLGYSSELLVALANTKIEVEDAVNIEDEQQVGRYKEIKSLSQQKADTASSSEEAPPCGIAFRKWLCSF